MRRPRSAEQPNPMQAVVDAALSDGERIQERASRRYSRGSARLGGFIAGLSGVCSVLFVEAVATGASVETDIITATPAVGFGVMAAIILNDALRTSEEAGAHHVRAEQYQ